MSFFFLQRRRCRPTVFLFFFLPFSSRPYRLSAAAAAAAAAEDLCDAYRPSMNARAAAAARRVSASGEGRAEGWGGMFFFCSIGSSFAFLDRLSLVLPLPLLLVREQRATALGLPYALSQRKRAEEKRTKKERERERGRRKRSKKKEKNELDLVFSLSRPPLHFSLSPADTATSVPSEFPSSLKCFTFQTRKKNRAARHIPTLS